MEARGGVIGTFLYAASARNYEVFRLIFTPDRIIVASLSWKSKNLLISLWDLIYWLLVFPFEGPSFGSVLMLRWKALKEEKMGEPSVSYDWLEAAEISKMNPFAMLLHDIYVISYSRVKRIEISENPVMKDCMVKLHAGTFSSRSFLIPEASLEEFKALAGKTPVGKAIESMD